MNAEMYKKVHLLAVKLLKADDANDSEKFSVFYNELKELCEKNEKDDSVNHPVQWEALADFTEDVDLAQTYYATALELAEAVGARDYIASISYSMGQMYLSSGDTKNAFLLANQAKESAKNSPDKELREDIYALLAQIKS